MNTRLISVKLPAYLLRLGYVIIFLCVGLFFFIAWLLEYKDTVVGEITITTAQMPLDLHANATGKLRLLQADNVGVTAGDNLAYIENAANMEDCLFLIEALEQEETRIEKRIPNLLAALKDKNIGAIKPTLLELSEAYQAYQVFLQNDRHQEIVATKRAQIQLHEEYITLSKNKIQLYDKNLVLRKEQLAVKEQLFKENVIAKIELEEAKLAYNELDLSGRLIDFQTAISSAKINKEQQAEAILQIESAYQLKKEQLHEPILDAYQRLKNEVKIWQEAYLIKADKAGKLVYSDYLSNYEYIKKGTKVMTILPKENTDYLGLLQLPATGFSKVQKGQPVHIRLDHYPYTEFGILKGEVAALPVLANNDNYLLRIAFPEGLRSTYNIPFQFKQLMKGQAEVITKRMSLWDRLINQMRSAKLND